MRITPTELHIDDPDYFDTLYARAGRRDKYVYFANRFGQASDSFSTVDHELHRNRRKAISPFFSAAKINEFQPVVRAKVDKLCKILAASQPDQVVCLSRAWMALTTDIITEYSFAKSYGQIDSPNFEETMHEALVTIYTTGHFALHFPIVFPILDSLPEWVVRAGQPAILPVVGLRKVSRHAFAPRQSTERFRTWQGASAKSEPASMKVTRRPSIRPSSTSCSPASCRRRRRRMHGSATRPSSSSPPA